MVEVVFASDSDRRLHFRKKGLLKEREKKGGNDPDIVALFINAS